MTETERLTFLTQNDGCFENTQGKNKLAGERFITCQHLLAHDHHSVVHLESKAKTIRLNRQLQAHGNSTSISPLQNDGDRLVLMRCVYPPSLQIGIALFSFACFENVCPTFRRSKSEVRERRRQLFRKLILNKGDHKPERRISPQAFVLPVKS